MSISSLDLSSFSKIESKIRTISSCSCLEGITKSKFLLCVTEILACPTKSEWFGMTYKSDLDMVKEKIKDLKAQGVYPEKLWE